MMDRHSLQPGSVLPESVRHVVQEKINDYARASGDFNPIHIDPAFAAGTAMGGTIAHGMLILAYVSDYMTGLFGLDWVNGGQLSCRFKDPARPGDVLNINGKVTAVENVEGRTIVSANVVCENQQGRTILLCDTKVKLS